MTLANFSAGRKLCYSRSRRCGPGGGCTLSPHYLPEKKTNIDMKLSFRALWLVAALLGVGVVTAAAQNPPKKAPAYKITNIKMVPFNEASGKFEDEISDADPRAFFNDLSISLFVTFEISGEAGSFEDGRKIFISVTEGKKSKYTKTEQIGLIGSEGRYYVPAFLYGSMCDTIKITAKITGQKTASSMSRRVPFMCGE